MLGGCEMTEGRGAAMEQADDETREKGTVAHALRATFPITIPILAGFLLTGMTCGIFVVSLGFPWWASTLMSVVVFAFLVVYCLKDVAWLSGAHGVPEAAGVLVAGGTYLWRRNMPFSIFTATALYMVLVNLVFV